MGASDSLRQEAGRHQRIAKRLLEMADEVDRLESESALRAVAQQAHNDAAHARYVAAVNRGSRLEQLKGFLQARGPMRRRDILDEFQKLGVPVNSIGTLLTTKNFAQDEQKRWFVKDEG